MQHGLVIRFIRVKDKDKQKNDPETLIYQQVYSNKIYYVYVSWRYTYFFSLLFSISGETGWLFHPDPRRSSRSDGWKRKSRLWKRTVQPFWFPSINRDHSRTIDYGYVQRWLKKRFFPFWLATCFLKIYHDGPNWFFFSIGESPSSVQLFKGSVQSVQAPPLMSEMGNIVSGVARGQTFVADYTVRAITNVVYLRVTRSLYQVVQELNQLNQDD